MTSTVATGSTAYEYLRHLITWPQCVYAFSSGDRLNCLRLHRCTIPFVSQYCDIHKLANETRNNLKRTKTKRAAFSLTTCKTRWARDARRTQKSRSPRLTKYNSLFSLLLEHDHAAAQPQNNARIQAMMKAYHNATHSHICKNKHSYEQAQRMHADMHASTTCNNTCLSIYTRIRLRSQRSARMRMFACARKYTNVIINIPCRNMNQVHNGTWKHKA